MRLSTLERLGFKGPLGSPEYIWLDFLRHDSGVRWRQGKTPDGFHHQGPDAPSAHRRPGYPLSGCVPAEPDSVSPGRGRLASTEQCDKPPSDTGVMPQKIQPNLLREAKGLLKPKRIKALRRILLPLRFGEETPLHLVGLRRSLASDSHSFESRIASEQLASAFWTVGDRASTRLRRVID